MTVTPHPSMFVSAGIAALVVWRLYQRVRRMVGRQRLAPFRPWATVVFFPLLVALLAAALIAHPMSLLALLAGVAMGAVLGRVGLSLTKFEALPEGLFYTPNAHLGIALSLLFIGRVAYRAVSLYLTPGAFATPPHDLARSPLTLLIFGTLAGYYVAYAAGLLRWRSRVETTRQLAPRPLP